MGRYTPASTGVTISKSVYLQYAVRTTIDTTAGIPKGAKAEIIEHSGASFFKPAAAPHAMKSAFLFGGGGGGGGDGGGEYEMKVKKSC